LIGQIINYRYEVLEKIGDGTYFSVYKARDKVLNRLVALKTLNKEYQDNREFAAAIVEGYQAASVLAHTSVARVFDAERTDDQCFVVCEYVRGINARERIRRAGPMAVPLALDVIIPVLEALEYAHANKIYHGDLRPQDVIVSPDGEVKVTDFGMAWALDRCPAIADTHPMRSIHCQAPEISEGAAPSIASDVYSAGVVLYEMLTGAAPHEGATAVSIALKKVKETPQPPRAINAAVPKSLSDIVMKAIEVQPGQRFESATAMLMGLRAIRDAMRVGQSASVPQPTAAAVESVAEPDEVSETGDRGIRRAFLIWTAFFLVVVIAVGGLTYMFVRNKNDITVPALLGKTWEEAQAIARDAGIELVDDGRSYSDIYKAGEICSVAPPAGSAVPRDTPVVKVKISNGASQVAVPDLKGMTEADANTAAAADGFAIGKIRQQYSDDVPISSVITQEPEAGLKRPPGSSIDIVVSQGPKPPSTSSEPEQPSASVGSGQQRRFSVDVEVPSDADGSQQVLIKVDDDRGDTIAYDEAHSPGDKFTVTVPTQGSSARIRVYVGGSLISDATY
jgi:beta-lactam-binding protein with PASTA domain